MPPRNTITGEPLTTSPIEVKPGEQFSMPFFLIPPNHDQESPSRPLLNILYSKLTTLSSAYEQHFAYAKAYETRSAEDREAQKEEYAMRESWLERQTRWICQDILVEVQRVVYSRDVRIVYEEVDEGEGERMKVPGAEDSKGGV